MGREIIDRFVEEVPLGWRRVPIGQALQEVSEPLRMRDSELYKLVSIRRRNGGMFLRSQLYGRQILTKDLQRVIPGSFVIARRQIIHGASALAADEFADAAVSSSYSLFVGRDGCDTEFFAWLACHPLMYAYFLDASHGIVIEKMNFDVGRWLSYAINLPPVSEQRRIVQILDAADQAIRSTERLIAKFELAKRGLVHDLLTRGITESGQFRDTDRLRQTALGPIPKGWTIRLLGGALTGIDAGRSPDLPDRPAHSGEWGVLKVSAIRPDGLQEAENKVVTQLSLIDSRIEVRHGDLLMSRANTPMLVGLACYVRNPRSCLMLSDKTLRLNVDLRKAVPEFLAYVLQAPSSRCQLESSGTGSSGSMKNISQAEICSLAVPLPEVQEQYRILTRLEGLRVYLDALRRELSKLQMVKRGLMDDLLTGRVRVGAVA